MRTASFEEPSQGSCWRLVWADYRAHYRYKDERAWRAAVLAAPRLFSNSSLHANLLVRLVGSGPTITAGFFRRLLILTHGCDFAPSARIGPGLMLSHPIGITVGPRVSIGRDVALFQGTTLLAGDSGSLCVGDAVNVFTGAFVRGSVTIGRAAIVGANAVVETDLEPGTAFTLSQFGSR